jgi:Flp pilus assembly protein TadG
MSRASRRSTPEGSDKECGAALVEFVLLVPLFLILTLGMVSAGIVYNQKLDLTHAAREGGRYGATIPENQCGAGLVTARNAKRSVDRG